MSEALNILLPGESFKSDVGATVTVYPMGVVHLKRFAGQIATALSIIGKTQYRKGASQKEIGAQIAAAIAPFLISEAMDLLEACVKIDPSEVKFQELPHWDVPVVVQMWLEASFGDEKKWRPWVTAIDVAMTKVTGTKFSTLEMLSKPSSQQATQEQTS